MSFDEDFVGRCCITSLSRCPFNRPKTPGIPLVIEKQATACRRVRKARCSLVMSGMSEDQNMPACTQSSGIHMCPASYNDKGKHLIDALPCFLSTRHQGPRESAGAHNPFQNSLCHVAVLSSGSSLFPSCLPLSEWRVYVGDVARRKSSMALTRRIVVSEAPSWIFFAGRHLMCLHPVDEANKVHASDRNVGILTLQPALRMIRLGSVST